MKKIFSSIMLFTAASLLFFSCKQESGIAITKRHYRNGYYVERNHSKPAVSKTQEAKASDNKQVKEPVSTAIQTPRQESTKQVIAATGKIVNDKIEKVKGVIHSLKPSSIKAESPVSTDKAVIKDQADNKNVFAEKKWMAKKSSGGHSIIWIIIVVLLILWGISLLTGQGGGGLLWLLLVVALILLILRLLGIL